ncbi:molybdopterin-guanine dinucleotide biosynthesis protein B [Chloroflexota bacterium]
MKTPKLSIVGRSGAGKTTLLEKLIPEIKRRGYRVATIKHHSHPGFEIDKPGKDTWRHAQAGSDHVIIAAPDKIASIRRLEQALSLDQIITNITDVDIILTEGYKRGGKPALEVVRAATGNELLCGAAQLVAVATDIPLQVEAPQFGLDEISKIVDFIENRFQLNQR